jgi:hypothetical protein
MATSESKLIEIKKLIKEHGCEQTTMLTPLYLRRLNADKIYLEQQVRNGK